MDDVLIEIEKVETFSNWDGYEPEMGLVETKVRASLYVS